MKKLACICLIALVMVSLVPAVQAGPLDMPRLTISHGGRFQEGILTDHCWTSLYLPFFVEDCETSNFDGPFPDPLRAPKLTGTLNISSIDPPDRIRLTAWTRLEGMRAGAGRGKGTPYTAPLEVTPSVAGAGDVSWQAEISLPARMKLAYIQVRASWDHKIHCAPCGRVWGEWNFFLRTR